MLAAGVCAAKEDDVGAGGIEGALGALGAIAEKGLVSVAEACRVLWRGG